MQRGPGPKAATENPKAATEDPKAATENPKAHRSNSPTDMRVRLRASLLPMDYCKDWPRHRAAAVVQCGIAHAATGAQCGIAVQPPRRPPWRPGAARWPNAGLPCSRRCGMRKPNARTEATQRAYRCARTRTRAATRASDTPPPPATAAGTDGQGARMD